MKKAINAQNLLYIAIFITAGLRLLAIGTTPLGLDVEEAQYWQWSTTPNLGYFTKPPMIAWVIGLGTSLFGENSFGVRALAPILHAAITILVMRIGVRVYSPRAGLIAAVIWMTLPISALGSQVITTDTPMILFLLVATLLLAPLAINEEVSTQHAVLAGLFTGLAMLSKYAAIYLPAGLVLWWIWSGRHQHIISLKHLSAYIGAAIISFLPNLIWNLNNGFVTARHLNHNANLEEAQYNILGSFEFILSQAGIVGPVIFAIAIIAMIMSLNDSKAKFWIALFIPAILVISLQAFLSDVNANWAVASWPAAIILLAGYCDNHWRGLQRPLLIGIGLNTSIMIAFLLVIFTGSLGPVAPSSDPLRHLKAWDLHARDIVDFAEQNNADQIVVMRRGYASKLLWELRGEDIQVKIVDRDGIPQNHFEQKFPWSPQPGQISVFINGEAMPPSFEDIKTKPKILWQGISEASTYPISSKQNRTLVMHLGLEQ